MKQILLFGLFLLTVTYSYGRNDSLLIAKIDSSLSSLNKYDLIQKNEITLLKEFQNKYEIKESLFSNQLSILTTIFSAIVAISIFIIGYLVPKLNNERHTNELNRLLSEFESIRDEITKSRKETAKVAVQNEYNNSKTMFFSCLDTDNKTGELLWGLRHVRDNFNRYGDAEDKDVEFYIDRAYDVVKEVNKEHNLREYVDEINELTQRLMNDYTVEGFKEKLQHIREEYNKIAWQNTRNEEKTTDNN